MLTYVASSTALCLYITWFEKMWAMPRPTSLYSVTILAACNVLSFNLNPSFITENRQLYYINTFSDYRNLNIKFPFLYLHTAEVTPDWKCVLPLNDVLSYEWVKYGYFILFCRHDIEWPCSYRIVSQRAIQIYAINCNHRIVLKRYSHNYRCLSIFIKYSI
jgi:hypothetical protein